MILHIDMDAFYASVEQLDNPGLKGKCVIVGGPSKRSVVSAASYEARKYGVRSAMPVFMAKQKCPEGVFVSPRIQRYKEVSKKIMKLLCDFSPLVEPVSIDEAYIDITGGERLLGSPEQVGIHIKEKIREKVKLTCSVGIAPNKFLAKIASDMEKPDGLFIIKPDEAHEFIKSLAINKVPGIGKKTGSLLENLGITTLGDVKKYREKILLSRLGKSGKRLIELSACIDNSPVTPFSQRKSVSTEHTLTEDTRDQTILKKFLLKHSEDVGRELRRLEVKAKTITLKLKQEDFKQITRSTTIDNPTQSSETIYSTACRLLLKYRLKTKIRLIGVGASGFVPSAMPFQMELFEQKEKKGNNWEKVERAIDAIIEKFGEDAVRRAALTENK
ncbi:MAG: DNA polymerase IV [Desulfobacterales bacterium]|nr:DNA polymerase IV [Desulfobacterales bacterium]MDX2510105.1 DNA polymerase IV [Desulfobacterales bacterium]